MQSVNRLTIGIPLVLALAVFMAGCYTMLKHPSNDLTAGHEQEYSDCASCHYEGFSQPLQTQWYDYWPALTLGFVAPPPPVRLPGYGPGCCPEDDYAGEGAGDPSSGGGRYIGRRGGIGAPGPIVQGVGSSGEAAESGVSSAAQAPPEKASSGSSNSSGNATRTHKNGSRGNDNASSTSGSRDRSAKPDDQKDKSKERNP